MPTRPNILLLVNDHQAYYRHGWDGGVKPQTPHFDRVAAGGILFEQNYTAVPLCGPSRRTLVTGLYPHNHKNFYNYTHSPYDHEIYLNTLAEHGYCNHYIGKWHAGDGTALDFQCQGYSETDYGNPYTSDEYRRYLKRKGLPAAEHRVERHFWNEPFRTQFPKLQDGARYKSEYAWCGEHAVGLTITPKETHEAYFLADLACDSLTQLANSADDQPFHLRVDFWGPHQPFFPTQEFADLYNPADITEYGSFGDTLEKKPELYREDKNRPLSDEDDHLLTPSPLPWSEWQKMLARAYGHITMVDAAGGVILDKLDELGLADNTIVLWTADHGDALASHGGRFDKGSFVTEEVIRTPLAVRYPSQIAPGQSSAKLTCSTDVAPTILDMAGTKFQNKVDGRSLLPLCLGKNNDWREDLLVESYGHGFGTHHIIRAVVTERYKYIANEGTLDELYDLAQDPYELENLVDNPPLAAVLSDMQARLHKWQRETGDLGSDDPHYQHAVAEDWPNLQKLIARREEKVNARQGTL